MNFKEIKLRAGRYPISGHPMAEEDEHTKKMYLLMLATVIVLDKEKYADSFATFFRIAAGMGFDAEAEDFIISAQTIKFDTLDEVTRLFMGDDRRLLMILECMLIAGTFDKDLQKASAFIADLSVMLKADKTQMTFLVSLARTVLAQDLNEYRSDIPNTYGELFDCYINVFEDEFEYEVLKANKYVKKKNCTYNINSITIDPNDPQIILLKYIYRPRGFGGAWLLNTVPEYNNETKKAKYKYIDYLFTNLSKNSITDLKEKFILGMCSNHPLAHSKAMERYIKAGGLLNDEEKDGEEN